MKIYFKILTLLVGCLIIYSCSENSRRNLLLGKWLFEISKNASSQSDTSSKLVVIFNGDGTGKRDMIVNGVLSNSTKNSFALIGNQLIVVEGTKTDSMLIVELSSNALRLTAPHSDTFTFHRIK